MRVARGRLAAILWMACSSLPDRPAVGAAALRPQGSEVVVSAALSIADAVSHAARRYEQATGDRVVLNGGASNTLARQILEGAPVDLFVSADEAQMDMVDAAGRLEPGTRVKLVANQLVVLVAADRARPLASVRDLLDPAFRRIAMGDPAAVPAGVYARRYLESLGLWPAIQLRIIPTPNVRAATMAVESGDADAAFAYRTEARLAPRTAIALAIPHDATPSIVYPAAIVRGAPHPAAAHRLLAYLQGREAQALFEQAGFVPLAAVGRPPPHGRGGSDEAP